MICDHCSRNQEDLFLFSLPCGYSVCFEHINSQDNFFECFECKDHQIDKDNCFQMKKNEKKLNQIIYNEKRQCILNLCDHVDSIKQDIGPWPIIFYTALLLRRRESSINSNSLKIFFFLLIRLNSYNNYFFSLELKIKLIFDFEHFVENRIKFFNKISLLFLNMKIEFNE
ncbi:hypothetical protein BpHYR1_013340 [Brachionus plicatilis]|uniref:Uncharacterized protein n=1 Tax=Brachionus plicatilis TaxID=10195 RepID=A0A3M7QE57_BRAPC|nr:hypothetical protein BpHYR1_013340 [Brachionus plicatilis]